MKSIQILGVARHDLIQGYRFYEQQATGVGRYFLDTLNAEKYPADQVRGSALKYSEYE